jgi:hypothetical protein
MAILGAKIDVVKPWFPFRKRSTNGGLSTSTGGYHQGNWLFCHHFEWHQLGHSFVNGDVNCDFLATIT